MFVGSVLVSFITHRFKYHTFKKAILDQEPDQVYECIVVGAGLSGLQSAQDLVNKYGLSYKDVLVLEAQSYVGGRVKQNGNFIPGKNIDLGAELIHGMDTSLTDLVEEIKEPISELFVWAQGDDGPLSHAVNGGYGLYYLKDDDKGTSELLRFDDDHHDFITTNGILHDLAEHDYELATNEYNLSDFLDANNIFNPTMIRMVEAGFSNTMCSTNDDLSLKQIIRWKKLWSEEGEDGDYRFVDSYKGIIDHLKRNLNIVCNCCVDLVDCSNKKDPRNSSNSMKDKNNYIELHIRQKTTYKSPDMDRDWEEKPTILRAKTCIVAVPAKVLTSKRLKFITSSQVDDGANDGHSNTEDLMPMYQVLESRNMFEAMKVFLSFNKRCWPKKLHGMIMAGNSLLIPETWFNYNDDKNYYYCTGFLTAKFANQFYNEAKKLCKSDTIEIIYQKMIKMFVDQLDEVFSKLEINHMSVEEGNDIEKESKEDLSTLPRPSDVFKDGLVYQWNNEFHPFIGGGYSSGKAGTYPEQINIFGDNIQKLPGTFFAGECTSYGPGATAHCALDTGKRAAKLCSTFRGK